MILFAILAIILLVLAGIALFAVAAGGATFIVVFGDVIVCIALIALIIRALSKRKK
jgi:hypothetical protein